jgi:hypothetical protein
VSDKIVYVHPDHEAEGVTITTPQELDALLESGWAVREQSRRKIDGKMVDVYHLHKERGLSVVQPSERDERHALTEHQHRGGNDARGVMVAPSNNSFLGTSDFNGLPGMKVANSMIINHAYSMGCDAAKRGEPITNCPWPEGIGRTQWLKGYKAAGASGDTTDAYAAGKFAAQGDADLEVHCPYPSGTAHYNEWLRGFKAGGGVVK